MIKQVVTETWTSVKTVKFTTSDKFDSDLIGKKEFQEVLSSIGSTRIVKYWIWAPKLLSKEQIDSAKKRLAEHEKKVSQLRSEKVLAKLTAKQTKKRVNNKSTAERIAEYKAIVAAGGVLMGCDQENWWE